MATPSESVEIYCLKCRAKTGSRDVEQVTLENGRPALRAVCSLCGTGKGVRPISHWRKQDRLFSEAVFFQRVCDSGFGTGQRAIN